MAVLTLAHAKAAAQVLVATKVATGRVPTAAAAICSASFGVAISASFGSGASMAEKAFPPSTYLGTWPAQIIQSVLILNII